MKSLRIGMVDLDTSHPANWVPVIRSLGHDVVGVYDGGTVYQPGYAATFAREHRIARVFESLEEMAEFVDVAIIHSCNWDIHIERARPFVRAQKAVLIDKPIAGNVRDLYQVLEWGKQGIRITGGSALRYAIEVKEWLSTHNAEDVLSASTGCAVDEFNYGIHAYSFIHGLLGPGIESVRHLGVNVQHHVEILWKDGRRGHVGVGTTKGYLPFYATVTTEQDVSHLQVDSRRLYQSLLEATLPYLAGEAEAPVPLDALIEVEMAAIAARLSWSTHDKRIVLNNIPLDDPGYDGALFAAAYRRQKMPG